MYQGVVPLTQSSNYLLVKQSRRGEAVVIGYRSVATLLMGRANSLPRHILEHIGSFGLTIELECDCVLGDDSGVKEECDLCSSRTIPFLNPVWDLLASATPSHLLKAFAKAIDPRLHALELRKDYEAQFQLDKVLNRRVRKYIHNSPALKQRVKDELLSLLRLTTAKAPEKRPSLKSYPCPIGNCQAALYSKHAMKTHLLTAHQGEIDANLLSQSACRTCTRLTLLQHHFDIPREQILQNPLCAPCGKLARGRAPNCMHSFVMLPVENGFYDISEMQGLLLSGSGADDAKAAASPAAPGEICVLGQSWSRRVALSKATRSALGIPPEASTVTRGFVREALQKIQTRVGKKRSSEAQAGSGQSSLAILAAALMQQAKKRQKQEEL
jgi:hypothetical protein